MKTFIVHISVDAETLERAEMIVKHCIEAGAITGCIASEEGEVAVVLKNTEEVVDETVNVGEAGSESST